MKSVLIPILLLGFLFNIFLISQAQTNFPGKYLFYNSKGKFGSCNHCHSIDGLSRRWNFETQSIDQEEGRKIPSLKGIGKRKDQDQIQRSIQMMRKMFSFKLTDEQISQLAEYLGTI